MHLLTSSSYNSVGIDSTFGLQLDIFEYFTVAEGFLQFIRNGHHFVSAFSPGKLFFEKIFVGHMSICGATDTSVLDFW